MTECTLPLTTEQEDELGRELDALKLRLVNDLGQPDRDYIYKVLRAQRALEVAGRSLLYLSFLPPFWLAGTAALSVSKILDNMEIGHNVLHGQYDWMRDPNLNSRAFEWDAACPADQWRHSHNYMHHTFTNILDKDRDIGYGILRMDETQKWTPAALANPVNAFLLMTFFQYGVMLHDLEAEHLLSGKTKWADTRELRKGMMSKLGRQTLKDYALFPALTGPLFLSTLAANATANLVRNLWSFSIIFCGHFPAGVATFAQEETENESRGAWYVRQMRGSANITGGKLFHILSGNLSHQIEHHLFPDIPARRYPQIAGEVRGLCEKYGLPYNTGRFSKQLGSTWAKIFRLALPNRRPSTKPTPNTIAEPGRVSVAA
jgi:fatty acid desaturase